MEITRRDLIKVSAATAVLGVFSEASAAFDDPLPSWNKGSAKEAILTFVKDTTEKSSSKFVEPKDRIATFDQDGTLWTEHPLYTQAMFALHRLGEMAPQHPEWKTTEPFKSVITGDREAMSKFSEKDWMEIVAVTHSGMGTEEFLALVKPWIATAKALRFDRPYTDLIFQPNGPGKAIGINMFIGKRPYAAFGNTAGDQQMLEWTQAGDGARLMMLVLHDDAQREYAYGPARGLPDTHVGTFSEALLDVANKSRWNVISMKNDWKRVFAFDK
jgi:hypothetical protein